jgi:hypothetical protein
MPRIFRGSIVSGTQISEALRFNSPNNPTGDLENAFILAHPRDPNAILSTFNHFKELLNLPGIGNVYYYGYQVYNSGPADTDYDIDI